MSYHDNALLNTHHISLPLCFSPPSPSPASHNMENNTSSPLSTSPAASPPRHLQQRRIPPRAAVLLIRKPPSSRGASHEWEYIGIRASSGRLRGSLVGHCRHLLGCCILDLLHGLALRRNRSNCLMNSYLVCLM
jgi:hypothetical protein